MYHYASMEDLNALCIGKEYKYVKQYNGIAKINRANNKLLSEKIGGLTTSDRKRIYLSGKTIRHARFNTGWGKGTFFHENYHTKGKSEYFDESGAYQTGYENGGRRYYGHNIKMMRFYGISR